MISLTVTNTSDFMNKLLVKETFDMLLLSEADIQTGSFYKIDGRINTSFYTAEELEALPDSQYSNWKMQRPHVFNLIKGKKVPSGLKIIFALSKKAIAKLIEKNDIDLDIDSVDGLFINVNYKDDAVTIITGTSLKTFTLDKSLEKAFDAYIKNTFEMAEIAYTEN
ncbi:DUF5721 family protein [Lachnospira sp.]|jgi:hypothetical protein|uniref:DUF5721 family protein n=1 Tax=Lachnospira sp. TaxID=2049031 RepID=UPI00258099E8|nr:DUF5721 family protein [Lachnospira sp.]